METGTELENGGELIARLEGVVLAKLRGERVVWLSSYVTKGVIACSHGHYFDTSVEAFSFYRCAVAERLLVEASRSKERAAIVLERALLRHEEAYCE